MFRAQIGNLFVFVYHRSRDKFQVYAHGENEPHILGMPQNLFYDFLFACDKKAAIKKVQAYSERRKPWANKNSDPRLVFHLRLSPPLLISSIILVPSFWIFIRHDGHPLLDCRLRLNKAPSPGSAFTAFLHPLDTVTAALDYPPTWIEIASFWVESWPCAL
jgi:hypothetical protein